MMHLIEQGIVKRKVYDNLQLQQGINAGRISSRVDGQLFDYARLSGLMPRRLDAPSLQALQYWGIIGAGVSLDGDALRVDGQTLANDVDDPQVRDGPVARRAGR